MQTIDLTPSTAGYRRILQTYRIAAANHELDISDAEAIQAGLDDTFRNPNHAELVSQALDLLIANRADSITKLNEAASQIENYFAAIEAGY